jgi:hypothetical protein
MTNESTNNENTKIFGRYYVYALIDPKTKSPFYIGKGEGNRAVQHFGSNVGLTPDEMLSQSECSEADVIRKTQKIRELQKLGFEAKDIARVICRRVNEDVAFAVESCLITSVYGYGSERLCNIVGGHHAERFRPLGNLDYNPSFDLTLGENKRFIANDSHKHGNFYVYVLLNPCDKSIFYVGKGTNNRLSQHFSDARQYDGSGDSNEKLSEISDLLKQGYTENDIGRIVAIVDTESLAFMLETLYIKFIIGYKQLTNLQSGQYSGLFRSKDDWQLRSGFDIPLIVNPGGPRTELRDLFLGDGLDVALYEVKEKLYEDSDYKNIIFSDAKVEGAGELCIDSIIDESITLRLQIRHALTYQISIKAINQSQKNWIVKHFQKLDAFPYKRKDFWFFPLAWRGSTGVTRDIDIAANRLKMMINLVRAASKEHVSEELLRGLPFPREITASENEIIKILL